MFKSRFARAGCVQAGIDEAGRGPVVGPLVVGLVAVDDPKVLENLDVRDSKLLRPARRRQLDEGIRRVARVETLAVPADELDRRMARWSLNRVEVDAFASLGRRVEADAYFLDACDTNAGRFGLEFLAGLKRAPPPPRVVSEHKADARYAVVSAASIVAKVHRDAAIRDIAARLEPEIGLPLGSGYSHDVVTRTFLQRYLEAKGRLPREARVAWSTSRDLIARRAQTTLTWDGKGKE